MTATDIIRELNRITAECGCELPELSDPTPAERAQSLLNCDDPPRSEDAELCRRIVNGTY
jgi:hypothetical protein